MVLRIGTWEYELAVSPQVEVDVCILGQHEPVKHDVPIVGIERASAYLHRRVLPRVPAAATEFLGRPQSTEAMTSDDKQPAGGTRWFIHDK